jgi:hypothetical protein
MKRLQPSKSFPRDVQLVMFGSHDTAPDGIHAREARRDENLRLLESEGWVKSGETVCMVEECYTPLEIWTSKRNGRRLERKYLHRDTLEIHGGRPWASTRKKAVDSKGVCILSIRRSTQLSEFPGVLGLQCGPCLGLTTRDGLRQRRQGPLLPGPDIKAAEKAVSWVFGRRRRPA